jgi:hypothetical protein
MIWGNKKKKKKKKKKKRKKKKEKRKKKKKKKNEICHVEKGGVGNFFKFLKNKMIIDLE